MTHLPRHTPSQNLILAQSEAALDKVWDKLFVKIEREMIRQVKKWEARWPRHKFRMALMHGRLLVFVDPPIMRESMPAHLNGWKVRGAIATLNKEIENFDDFLCDVESVMGRPADGLDTKKTPNME